jgi:hypothetical protein
MLFRSYTPRAPLCEFVEDFRMYENYAGEHLRERILREGLAQLREIRRDFDRPLDRWTIGDCMSWELSCSSQFHAHVIDQCRALVPRLA